MFPFHLKYLRNNLLHYIKIKIIDKLKIICKNQLKYNKIKQNMDVEEFDSYFDGEN